MCLYYILPLQPFQVLQGLSTIFQPAASIKLQQNGFPGSDFEENAPLNYLLFSHTYRIVREKLYMGGDLQCCRLQPPSQRSKVDPRFSIPGSWVAGKDLFPLLWQNTKMVFISTSNCMSKHLSASSNTRISKDFIQWLNPITQSFRTCPPSGYFEVFNPPMSSLRFPSPV